MPSRSLSFTRYFNPRPPRGGRLDFCTAKLSQSKFQSTPSARRATKDQWYSALQIKISIHALREEGDVVADRR